MSNQYSYIDPDYVYSDPKTGVLRNLANVADFDTLILIESGAVTKRITELQANPIKIKDSSTLLDIHRHLFQDSVAPKLNLPKRDNSYKVVYYRTWRRV
nr:filamentation induced by cAMP protein Fic [uncultured bacterium]